MNITALVEPNATGGFRAATTAPAAVAEGASRQEALARLRDEVRRRLASGASLVELPVGELANPWAAIAGIFPDDEVTREWRDAIAERRRRLAADDETP